MFDWRRGRTREYRGKGFLYPLVLSWEDIKLTQLMGTIVFSFSLVLFSLLPSFCSTLFPLLPFCFYLYLNRLRTERCRRCPDAGVGWGFRWGIFGLGFPRPCGGRVSLRSYMEPRNNPWEVHPNWEQSVTPICCTR